ncbi:restriction endonuclease subunit S [Aliarcobacter cryaerophilus]|uniref:restriction endonuclease subunit S n=1 Tax=Aliarcobacter cryaerophilus TaxID=28198 RepID=UPI0021B58AFD|nr:restriction endonuclease subunit S [Aliarcobacter cryaerophilus]MCT7539592.1 restriction endonuclease subunit S [Aliarcobacter cryaerophilus]
MKYKKYSSYKDSGVEWLGEIPSEWKCVKTAYFFKAAMGQTILKEDLEDDGIYPVYSATMEDKFFGYINNPLVILNKDDLVIPARGNSIGNVKLVTEKSTTTQTTIYCKQITNATNANFIYYYMNGLKDNLFYFVQTAIPQITVSEVISNPLLVPSIKEQQQIANFLDKATAKIDTLIEKQTKQIELLKEKRQAVISHAVTKGINPNVPMKDSGVEWLGEIPEHWEVSKLRFLFSFSTGLNITKANLIDEDGIPCVNYGEIHSKYGFQVNANKDSLKYVDKEYLITSKTSLLSEGDFVFADTSEDVKGSGNFTHVVGDSKIFAGYHTVIARLINNYNSRFFAYIFDSNIFRTQIQLSIKGVKVFSITQAILKNCLIWFPVIEEQQQIANYLDEKTLKIDILIEKSNKSIELLKEKRTALISAAVTGKIDVREFE